jgi:hypothetical protein
MKQGDSADPGTGLNCSRSLSRMGFSCVSQEPEAAPRRKCITTTAVRIFASVHGSPRPYKARRGEFTEDNGAAAIEK